jgi:hypothetical protein
MPLLGEQYHASYLTLGGRDPYCSLAALTGGSFWL